MSDLRALAEAATPGPWQSQASEDAPPNALVYGPDGDSFAYLSWNPGNDYDVVATAAYIAAVSPDVVVALLDQLESLRSGIAGLPRYVSPDGDETWLEWAAVRDLLADTATPPTDT